LKQSFQYEKEISENEISANKFDIKQIS